MAWVKIDDQFTDHPKAAEAGPLGVAMHVAGLCYCNRHLTDGFISEAVAARLLNFGGIYTAQFPGGILEESQEVHWRSVVDSLVHARLWEQIAGEYSGWMIHDYLEYNPSKAETLAKREADVARKRKPPLEKPQMRESAWIPNGNATDSKPPVPVPVPVLKETLAPKTARQGDALWDALVEAMGHSVTTGTARGAWNKALADLRKAGATPEQIVLRADRYRARWPDRDCTPNALAKWWDELTTDTPRSTNGRTQAGQRNPDGTLKLAL
jgi:hypothetical protein